MRTPDGHWLLVAAATTAIYATLPIGPELWGAFSRRTGPIAEHLTAIVLVLVATAVAVVLRRRIRALRGPAIVLVLVAIAVYAVAVTRPTLTAAEKTHFLSYGVLALLVRRALSAPGLASPVLVRGATLVGLIGLGDEVIQHLLPGRYFEWKDVAMNAVGGLLALTLAGVLSAARPAHAPAAISASGASRRTAAPGRPRRRRRGWIRRTPGGSRR